MRWERGVGHRPPLGGGNELTCFFTVYHILVILTGGDQRGYIKRERDIWLQCTVLISRLSQRGNSFDDSIRPFLEFYS